jgi:CzcA family heavy metal efflux pump
LNLAGWAALHRRSILFLLLLAALFGGLAAYKLPVAIFPQIDFPRVVVSLDAGDRPADHMVVQVTRPVEVAVRSVRGVREIRSTSTRGSAEISVNFAWGTDMQVATLDVEAAVARLAATLPTGTVFTVRRMDPTVFPVAAYNLTSRTVDQARLRAVSEYDLIPLLSAVNGVAKVTALGGDIAEFQVDVNPDDLVAYGLTIDDVAKALSSSNVLQAVGRLQDWHKLFLVLTDDRLTTLDEISHTIIRSGPNGKIELEDIAKIVRGPAPQWVIVSADGTPAVSLQVYQQPDGNTIQIVQDVDQVLQARLDKLPAGTEVKAWYDQGELVAASARSVRDAIVIGVVLAALILLVFLRSFRITLIVIIVVPAVLAISVLVLYAAGMSFNIMTLGGMAAAIGLVIDDAIVLVEQIVRRVSTLSEGSRVDRVRIAVLEFGRPLVGSSLATIIIFLPLAFLTSVVGAFFKALSFTMASILIISLLVSWLVIPLLSEHLLHPGAEEGEAGNASRLGRGYEWLLSRLLKHPWLVLPFVLLIVGAGLLAYPNVGSGFMPAMDEGGFVLDYRAPPGTSLTDTNELVQRVENVLRATPEVLTYSRRTGSQLSGTVTEANQGDFFVRLKPLPRRPIDQVMADVRERIEQTVPGLQVELAQLMEDLIGDLTAVPQPVEIKIFGDDVKALLATARKVADAISQVRGIVSVNDGIQIAGDALAIEVDRQKAAVEGLDPMSVTTQVASFLTGNVATQVQIGPQTINVRVWPSAEHRRFMSDVARMLLRAPDGHLVVLNRVASLERIVGQPQVVRDNLKRMVPVTARVEGRDVGSTMGEVKAVLTQNGLIPKQLDYGLGGLYKEQQKAFIQLMIIFVAAVSLVFVLLLFLYEDFTIAIQVLLVPIVAMSAVFAGLFLTGIDLNISALMGLTMVVGIVTEVAIFYFSEFERLKADGMPVEQALVTAGRNRLRPIAMTTIAAAFALLPLALALGQGAAMQQPLAIAIISGLAVQMPLVLLIMPATFLALLRLLGSEPSRRAS